MAFEPLSAIPCQFESGTSVTVRMRLSGVVPSEGAVGAAKLYLSTGNSAVANYASTSSGDDFIFTISAAASAALAPGKYAWAIRFTYTAGEVVNIDNGQLTISPNPATNQTASQAQAMVTLLETVLRAFAATNKVSVSINNQSFTRASIRDYEKSYIFWKSQLKKEQDALAGVSSVRNYAPNFGGPYPSPFCGHC